MSWIIILYICFLNDWQINLKPKPLIVQIWNFQNVFCVPNRHPIRNDFLRCVPGIDLFEKIRIIFKFFDFYEIWCVHVGSFWSKLPSGAHFGINFTVCSLYGTEISLCLCQCMERIFLWNPSIRWNYIYGFICKKFET